MDQYKTEYYTHISRMVLFAYMMITVTWSSNEQLNQNMTQLMLSIYQ